MTRQDDHRVACATLTYLAEPADPVLGILLQALGPVEVLASIRSGTIPVRAARAMNQAQAAGLRSALAGTTAPHTGGRRHGTARGRRHPADMPRRTRPAAAA